MQRPAWTISLALVWLLLLPGIILTHHALNSLIPSLTDLPDNILKGFDETFKFAYLERDAKKIKAACVEVLDLCNVAPKSDCSTYAPVMGEKDTSAGKDKIVASFASSLSIVQKVANDKYFGVADLEETADNLNTIKQDIDDSPDKMQCVQLMPTYCEIHNAANGISQGMSAVTEALDSFRNNKIVEQWGDYSTYLVYLHALPWILVLGMLCFMVFWYKGGACCPAGLCLIPFVLLWLLNFVVYLIICATGVAVQYGADQVSVTDLKGEPTLADVIEHIKTAFSEFWDLVFAGMVEGGSLLVNASFFYVAVTVIIMLYSMCMCCCRPYADGKSSSSYTGPLDEEKGRQFIEALRAEYVDGQGAKVGAFVDPLGPDGQKFIQFEEEIRNAGNKEEAINKLAGDWGI